MPPEHPDLAPALDTLAGILNALGRPAEAEPLAREAVGYVQKAYGENHPWGALEVITLADALAGLSRAAEAEPLYRRALAIQAKALPAGHPDTAFGLVGLGRLLIATGRADEAQPFLQQAVEIRQKNLKAGDWGIAVAESALGACFTAQGRYEDAEKLLRGAAPVLAEAGRRDAGGDHESRAARGPLQDVAPALGSHPVKIKSAEVLVTSPGRNFVTLKLTTEDGLYGLGDATLNGRELAVKSYLEEHVVPLLIGRDARRIEDTWQYLYKGAYWRRGPVTMTAIGAVDVALWDIRGKALNVPVYQLLGGASRDSVMVYGHANGRTSKTPWPRWPGTTRKATRPSAPSRAFPASPASTASARGRCTTSPRCAGPPPRRASGPPSATSTSPPSCSRACARSSGPHVHLLHDVHHRLTPIEAARLGKALEPYHLFWMEDAVPAELQEGFRLIRQHTTTPLAVGEVFNTIHDCEALIKDQWIDYIRMTPSHAGGISHLLKIAHFAELYHVRTGCHGATDMSPVCMAAALHFDLAVHNFGIQEYMRHSEETDRVFPHAYTFARGRCIRATPPGSGSTSTRTSTTSTPMRPPTSRWRGDSTARSTAGDAEASMTSYGLHPQGKEPPKDVTVLVAQVETDGGVVLAVYREPVGDHWQIFALLPRERVEPTPYQRDLSPTHAKRLTDVVKKLDRFVDPIVAVSPKPGLYWTPNGHHRLTALTKLKAEWVPAILIPEYAVAYQILALNTEKAHNLKEKSLEVIRMYRGLLEEQPKTGEEDFVFQFEAPHFITLGLLYEENKRFAGGAFAPILKRVDKFLKGKLGDTLRSARSGRRR